MIHVDLVAQESGGTWTVKEMVREADYSLELPSTSEDSSLAVSPLGRNKWRYNDPVCGIGTSSTNLTITISACSLAIVAPRHDVSPRYVGSLPAQT